MKNAKQVTWENVQIRLGELKPWDENPKKLDPKDARDLLKSWDELGQFQTVAIGPAGEVYDGHQRLSTLLSAFGPDLEVKALRSSRPLTRTEREKITLYSRQYGQWDWDKLQTWDHKNVIEWGGFTTAYQKTLKGDIDGIGALLIKKEKSQAEAEKEMIERAAQLREKWQTAPGQLWKLGNHRLICGDCTDPDTLGRLMDGAQALYGFHDPPYGIAVVGNKRIGGDKPFKGGKIGESHTVKAGIYEPVLGDDKPFDPSYILTLSKFCILWGANYYSDKLSPQKGWIVWDKKGRDDWKDTFSDCELAWSNLETVTRIYRHVWLGMIQEGEREIRMHPTQKPVALYVKIIQELLKDKDGIILDCYSGSGPTLLASERLGRTCRAVELSPAYVAVALERWAKETGKRPVKIEAS
jgi:hypothetical protein